ncbi:MarR family winged helix-turn-helix transcriptional regulator [Kitasatospora mediocidica]|uniref:MarR family winged helix-turn-helix transcriptional regulator n=1 Tax=Kitasatospora mediocidica TaxID=58352 RepID=UPI00055E8100|nr:MarR family winged helix-turn-helix transcriptional regulator [Kitasatospora mediocidica]
MSEAELPEVTTTLVYRLGGLGAIASARFAAAVEPLGIRPKHVALMAVLSAGAAASQLELAQTLGVVASVVVGLTDRLEALGAVERLRDPDDRRRHRLSLTPAGRTLLASCTAAATALDAELTASLSPAEAQSLHRAVGVLASETGLPA